MSLHCSCADIITEQKQAQEAAQAKAREVPGAPTAKARPQKSIADDFAPPNKILFVQSLPEEFGADALINIFSQFPGYQEVRYIGFRNVAFVEFDTAENAAPAKNATASMAVGDHQKPMKVTYQKKE